MLGITGGSCRLAGLTGYGGSQFPTVLLNPNVLCENLDMKAPSCLCRGDGGTVEISFEADRELGGAALDVRVRSAQVAFDRIPPSPSAETGAGGAG